VSAYTGQQGKGAATTRRATRRAEAEARNLATPPERRRYYRRPCPSGKRKYATESQARTELVGALVGANSGDGKRHEKRVYECPACGHWHLTSKPAMAARKVREP